MPAREVPARFCVCPKCSGLNKKTWELLTAHFHAILLVSRRLHLLVPRRMSARAQAPFLPSHPPILFMRPAEQSAFVPHSPTAVWAGAGHDGEIPVRRGGQPGPARWPGQNRADRLLSQPGRQYVPSPIRCRAAWALIASAWQTPPAARCWPARLRAGASRTPSIFRP